MQQDKPLRMRMTPF